MLVAHSLLHILHSKTVSFLCQNHFFYHDLPYHNAVVSAIMHSIEENLCSWHGVFYSIHILSQYFSFLKQLFQNFSTVQLVTSFFLKEWR